MGFDGFTPLDSGHLDAAKYDSLNCRLTIRFRNRYVYDVHGVSPEGHQAFMDSSSPGEHFHQVLKDNYHVTRVK